jgi:hypothetical protein
MAGVDARGEALYRELCASLEREGILIRDKCDSRFCKVLDRALKIITFGRQDRFMSEYVTTLGKRIYVPSQWSDQALGHRYLTLRHEAVHVRQFRRLTWPGMTLLYLFLPLPVGLAGGRAWLEWQAYRETLVATWQLYGPAAAREKRLHDHIVERFTSADYAWMWLPGRQVRRWIDKTLATLEASPPPPLR